VWLSLLYVDSEGTSRIHLNSSKSIRLGGKNRREKRLFGCIVIYIRRKCSAYHRLGAWSGCTKIREIADRCHIPLIKNPLLAEVLVEAEIGSCIPEDTYQAVAAIFAFLEKKDGIIGAETN